MNRRRRLLVALLVVMLLSVLASAQEGEIDCTELAPENATATYFVGLGDVYFAQNRHAQTIDAYTCALERDPSYAPAYVRRGFAHAAQRNDPAALADYNRALELDESLVSAYNNRGLLYTSQGNFGLAITDFTLAIALAPNDPTAFNNRAVVHAIEGHYDLALADLEQAITLDPNYAAPHATLGAIYSALAAESYRQYFEVAGEAVRRLPAGDADIVLNAISESLITGNFSIWLALQTPAR